jgi:uncharacterized membrane protein
MNKNLTTQNRITSLDMLRGFVMLLMALDHIRDYFHNDSILISPTDLSQTNGALFFTRLITHVCAPVFIFLAGSSAFFVGQKIGKKDLSIWLIKRGIWLVIAEVTIVNFGWMFHLPLKEIYLQVIWAIGISMILLAGIIHLPKKLALAICLIGIFGHNALDGWAPTGDFRLLWSFLHVGDMFQLGDTVYFIAYPIIPWVFVMGAGYYFGQIYLPTFDSSKRIRLLRILGVSAIVLFVVVRYTNLYGDLEQWKAYDSTLFTVMSFLNVTKYPPSLMYLLLTLGPALIFLSFAEKWGNAILSKVVTIGRVPMFYYIAHLYLIHGLAVLAAGFSGYHFSDMFLQKWVSEVPELVGFGFDLWVTYAVWIFVTLCLYPLCKKYLAYKQNNRDKWWLSYL